MNAAFGFGINIFSSAIYFHPFFPPPLKRSMRRVRIVLKSRMVSLGGLTSSFALFQFAVKELLTSRKNSFFNILFYKRLIGNIDLICLFFNPIDEIFRNSN